VQRHPGPQVSPPSGIRTHILCAPHPHVDVSRLACSARKIGF
jgi:hypothetical protein